MYVSGTGREDRRRGIAAEGTRYRELQDRELRVERNEELLMYEAEEDAGGRKRTL